MKDIIFQAIIYLKKKAPPVDPGDVANVAPPFVEITAAMIAVGTRIIRESGALAREGTSDSLLVLEILEGALDCLQGDQRNSKARKLARKIAAQVATRL